MPSITLSPRISPVKLACFLEACSILFEVDLPISHFLMQQIQAILCFLKNIRVFLVDG